MCLFVMLGNDITHLLCKFEPQKSLGQVSHGFFGFFWCFGVLAKIGENRLSAPKNSDESQVLAECRATNHPKDLIVCVDDVCKRRARKRPQYYVFRGQIELGKGLEPHQ